MASAFRPPLGSGVYGFWWRVAAEDGHVVEGMFTFTVEVPQVESTAEQSVDSAAAAPAESADGTAATAGTDEDPPGRTSDTGTAQDGSTAPTTALRADGTTPSAVTTTLPSSATPAITIPAESAAASASDPPRQPPGSSGAAGAERLAEALRIMGLLATLAIVGGLAFALFVVRGQPSEQARVRRVLFVGGIVLVSSAVAAAPTQAVVFEGDWSAFASADAITDALSTPFGIAVGLRVLGGLVVLALTRPHAASPGRNRFPVLGLIGAAFVIASYSFDGHTVSEGPRWLHAAANATHVSAAAVWSGGLALLAALLRRRFRSGSDALQPLLRFSQVASVSLVLAGLAGTVMAVLVMNRIADLWSSAWGRLLLAKIALVAFAACLGARNRWTHLPAAARFPGGSRSDPAYQRLFRTVAVEAVALGCTGVVTAFLVGASAL
jgi:copper transport protein